MKVLLERVYKLSEKNSRTNLYIPVKLDLSYDRLLIDFEYNPKYIDVEEAREIIEKSLQYYIPDYIPEDKMGIYGNVENYLPLENLITLSLDHNGNYMGAHHCKESVQNIVISKTESTKGFSKQQISKGVWDIQMNLHCIVSKELNLKIKIVVE